MADAVKTYVLQNSSKFYEAQFTNLCDGTGENAVKKIDISTLINQLGAAPTKVKILYAKWAVSGMSVGIQFNHTTPDEVMLLVGTGQKDYRKSQPLIDPGTTGGTGDIQFKTYGHAANDSYDITLMIGLSNK